MDERKERINSVIETLKLSKPSFANHCGIAPANLIKMLNGEQMIQDTVLDEISEAFPQISLDWLKTGSGQMLATTPDSTASSDSHTPTPFMTDDLRKLLSDFISVQESQGRLLEKAIEQMGRAMQQTDRAIENTDRLLSELSEQREQMNRLISTLMNTSLN